MFKARTISIIPLLLVTITCFSDSCLRFSSETKLITNIEKRLPKGTEYEKAMAILFSDCPDAHVLGYTYGDQPLNYNKNGTKIDVYRWVEATEGAYRFANRLFLKSHTQVKIYFNKDGKVIDYEATIYTDSL